MDELADDGPLIDTLTLLVTPGEELGLEDMGISLQEWFSACRPARLTSDLAFLVHLLRDSSLSPRLQGHLYEQCNLPIRFEGRHPSQIVMTGGRTSYQKRPFSRRREPIASVIRRPLGATSSGKPSLVDRALETLAVRPLEIYPLTHANPADVTVVDCGRGLGVVLIGVLPSRRSALEALYVFLITKNGVPIGYGPAAVFVGCCEMGINLFPEFRGGDIRETYAQLMRVLHHRLGVDYFYLTRYGMGENNPAALASGAFWFYRKLGFQPTNSKVDRLAREEEARMRAEPGHRSDRRMLRRLSRTEACFDLSDGRRQPFDFGALGVAVSRMTARDFGGDRSRATAETAARLSGLLAVPEDHPSLRMLAPLLALVPDIDRWSRTDIRRLAGIVRAKGGGSERRAALGWVATEAHSCRRPPHPTLFRTTRGAPRQGQSIKPATHAVMNVVSEPPRMERSPRLATSWRRSGAIPPIPPSRIAREPKFAKPHSAYEAMT